LEPEGPADYFYRANLAANRYRGEEAIADLQGVVQTKPEFWQAHYLLGIQLAAIGRNEDAQKEFSAAIHFRPDFAPAHLYLGITLASQHKQEQALAEFHTVLQLDPTNSSAREEIAAIQVAGKSSRDLEKVASPPSQPDK
jgi:Flp pilus assembly protein TadD